MPIAKTSTDSTIRLWCVGTRIVLFFMEIQTCVITTGVKPSPGLAPGTVVKHRAKPSAHHSVSRLSLAARPDVDVRIGTDDVALRVTNDVRLQRRRRTSRSIVVRRLSHRLEAFGGLCGGVGSRRDVARAEVWVVGLGEGRGSDEGGQSHGSDKLIHFHLHSLMVRIDDNDASAVADGAEMDFSLAGRHHICVLKN